MIMSFASVDLNERPLLKLKNASGDTLGILSLLTELNFDIKYNETSTLSFKIPAYIDGVPTPLYDAIASRQIVFVPGIGQFTIVNPTEFGDGVERYKTCDAYSLEYEFTYKKITLEHDTYKFWDATAPQDTVLGMIMELMPSWTVKFVASGVANKWRTFDIDTENLYNFMKSTLQQTYECIFDFDTVNRWVIVRDVNTDVANKSVYLSSDNLIKDVEIEENTEDMVTRLDVRGAEGVDIRDVNPTGTNKIIDLSHYMTTDNFPQEVIDQYNSWQELVHSLETRYYNLSVRYAMRMAQLTLERANLRDLEGSLQSSVNQQGVAAEAAASGISVDPQTLINVYNEISDKQDSIDIQRQFVKDIEDDCADLLDDLRDIVEQCRFETYFDEDTYKLLDRYLIDGEIEDSTFVVEEVETFSDIGVTGFYDNLELQFTSSNMSKDPDDGSNKLELSWTDGCYIEIEGEQAGEAVLYDRWRYSDYVDIDGVTVLSTTTTAADNMQYNAFYDSSKAFVASFKAGESVPVPGNVKYMRMSCRYSETVTATKLVYGNIVGEDYPTIINGGTLKITDDFFADIITMTFDWNEQESSGGSKEFTLNWIEGGYISKDGDNAGEVVDYDNWKYSDFINIKYVTDISTTTTAPDNADYNAFYDATRTFIASFSAGQSVVVPSNAKYMRLSCRVSEVVTATDETEDEEQQTGNVSLRWTEGGYLINEGEHAGEIEEYSSWKYSDYVDIKNVTVISTTTDASDYLDYNVFYDSNKQFIKKFTAGKEIAVPTNARYFRLSCRRNTTMTAKKVSYDRSRGSFTATAHLGYSKVYDAELNDGYLTIVGNTENKTLRVEHSEEEEWYALDIENVYIYLTANPNEYTRRSVAWELYAYGQNTLNKLAHPSYTFSMNSANFLVLSDFDAFKQELELGQSIYFASLNDELLKPICIGVSFNWFDPASLNIQFSDSYVSNDKKFRLVDLLEQSISMGRNVDTSKYTYSAFVDSGANTVLKNMQESAIDVAKNAITSSSAQAITWDSAGLRLRKHVDDKYDDEQIWMNNNSILMTDDGWRTAKMAIGKFYDNNLRSYVWGIAAPRIVGTILAGSSLIIESEKKEGGTAVFRVDSEGCVLYNSIFTIENASRKIVIDPNVGIAIGNRSMVYDEDEEDGGTTFKENANFWVDSSGNITMRGNITATSLSIVSGDSASALQDMLGGLQTDLNDSASISAIALQTLINSLGNNLDYMDNYMQSLIDKLNVQIQEASSSSTKIFYDDDDRSNASIGDLWYNTSGSKVYKYTGYWDYFSSSTLRSWMDAIASSPYISSSDNQVVVYNTGSTHPDSNLLNPGDVWIGESSGSRTVNVWTGTQWNVAGDGYLSGFIDLLDDSVNESATIYFGATEPNSAVSGDFWYDTNTQVLKLKGAACNEMTWDGSEYDSQGYMLSPVALIRKMCKSKGATRSIRGIYRQSTEPSKDQGITDGDYWYSGSPQSGAYKDSWLSQYFNYDWNYAFGASDKIAYVCYSNLYNIITSIYGAYNTDSESKIYIYQVNNIGDALATNSIPDNHIIYDKDADKVYVKKSPWQDVSSDSAKYAMGLVVSYKSNSRSSIKVYRNGSEPATVERADIRFDSNNMLLEVWDSTQYVAQRGRADYDASLLAVFPNNSTHPLYLQATTPTLANLNIGDIWFDISGKIIRRYSYTTEWEDVTDQIEATAITAQQTANNVSNGTTGISFTDNNILVEINKTSGLLAITHYVIDAITYQGSGPYFQVNNNRMGFFNSNNDALLYYEGIPGRPGIMRFANDWNDLGVLPNSNFTAATSTVCGRDAGCGYRVEGNHVYVSVNVKSATAVSGWQVINQTDIPSDYCPSGLVHGIGITSIDTVLVGYVTSTGIIRIKDPGVFDWCDLVIDYVI